MLLDSFRQRKAPNNAIEENPKSVGKGASKGSEIEKGMAGQTRRNILLAGAGALALFGVSKVPMVRDIGMDIVHSEELHKNIEEKVKFIKDTYGLDILGTPLETEAERIFRVKINTEMGIKESPTSLSQVDKALDCIVKEFRKYPKFFIKNINIPRVIIVDKLLRDGSNLSGLVLKISPNHNYGNSMYIKVSYGLTQTGELSGDEGRTLLAMYFEHEFFHALQNISDEKYNMSLSKDIDHIFESSENEVSLVNYHAKGGPREDFASTGAAMMTGLDNIWGKVKTDKKLAEKVEFIKHLIFNKTYGIINEEYWELLRAGKLTPDFFNKRQFYLLSLNFEDFQKELRNPNNSKTYLDLSEAKGVANEEGVYKVFQGFLSEATL